MWRVWLVPVLPNFEQQKSRLLWCNSVLCVRAKPSNGLCYRPMTAVLGSRVAGPIRMLPR